MAVAAPPRKFKRMSSSKLRSLLNVNQDQKDALRGEISMSHMNYQHMAHKLIKKNYAYFTLVVLYELFAVFKPDADGPHRHAWRYEPRDAVLNISDDHPSCHGEPWLAGWLLVHANYTF